MGSGLVWILSSAGGYLGVAMLGYRLQYIRTFKRYRRWQLEAPEARVRYDRGQYSGPGYGGTARKHLSYKRWFNTPDYEHKASEFPAPYMFAWPVTLGILLGDKFLHPEIKLPDPKKIAEIEAGKIDDLDAKLADAERHLCKGGCVC